MHARRARNGERVMSDRTDGLASAMHVGVVRESTETESRVALTPDGVRKVVKLGYAVVIEAGAGVRAGFEDAAYAAAGAEVSARPVWDADVVVTVNAPTPDEIGQLRPGAVLIGALEPRLAPQRLTALAARGVTALAVDAVPRISRAQSLDVLSSMANIAGYRAVIEAAHNFGRFFTGQVPAAGKVPPAEVLVAGAGVAATTANGVTIIGYTDLPGRLPAQASQLYGTNLVNLMKLLTPGKDGQLVLDLDDVVQ